MNLKFLLATGLLSCALTLPAGAILPNEYAGLKGFGLRCTLGYSHAHNKFKRNYNNTPANLAFRDHVTLTAKSFSGGVDIHYGWFTKKSIYVGGEVFYNYLGTSDSTTNLRIQGLANRLHLKYGSSIGGAAKLGGILFGALHYVKVGGAFTEIKTTSSLPNISQGRTDRFRGGWLVGVGAEAPISKIVAVGGEIIHSEYAKTAISQTISTTANVHYRIKPVINVVMLTAKVKIGY